MVKSNRSFNFKFKGSLSGSFVSTFFFKMFNFRGSTTAFPLFIRSIKGTQLNKLKVYCNIKIIISPFSYLKVLVSKLNDSLQMSGNYFPWPVFLALLCAVPLKYCNKKGLL